LHQGHAHHPAQRHVSHHARGHHARLRAEPHRHKAHSAHPAAKARRGVHPAHTAKHHSVSHVKSRPKHVVVKTTAKPSKAAKKGKSRR